MRIILAPDSFKGTYSAKEVALLMKLRIDAEIQNAEVISIPISDGGEGMLEAVGMAFDGNKMNDMVTGPLGKHQRVKAEWLLSGDIAVIEMAKASGLTLVSEAERNPVETTSRGVGELIVSAMEHGARHIYIGLGGSATNDGGIGMAMALGFVFEDFDGNPVSDGGKSLEKIVRIDSSKAHPLLKATAFTVLCDVTNPLTGLNGATYVYGPQKGATREQLDLLEKGMIHYARSLDKYSNYGVSQLPGSGAAGGLGAALRVFCKAKLVSGIEAVLNLTHFDEKCEGAWAIITGEGRVDAQSAEGKVLSGIAGRVKEKDIYLLALAGSLGKGYEAALNLGYDAIFTVQDSPLSEREIVQDKELRMEASLDMMMEWIKAHMNSSN